MKAFLILVLLLLSGCVETAQVEDLTEEIQEEVKEEEFCHLKFDDYCYLYSEKSYRQRIWGLGEDEAESYNKEREKAFNRYPTTGKVEINLKHNLLYVEPENWYVMKNYKMAGMDVPISYFKSIDPKRPSATEVEIRIVYYENKDKLTIEDFKEKLVPLLTNGQIKKSFPKSWEIPFGRKSLEEEFKERHAEKGIWFEVYKYGDYEENYYYVEILERENGFYAFIFKDPMQRNVGSYERDPAFKAFDRFMGDFRFTDYADNKIEIRVTPNNIWGSSLSFEKPTEVRYKIKSDGKIDFCFVKSWDDFWDFVKHPRTERVEYYENCKHFGIEEIEGSCTVTKSRFVIGNLQTKEKNVVIELDWS